MKPSLYTFDGNAINDTTNYVARIPIDAPIQAAQSNSIFISRAGASPVLAGSIVGESYFTINIICKGTVRDQLETLNQWFSVYDDTPKQLIIKDTDDSDKQYYIYCVPQSAPTLIGTNTYQITMARKDPIWQSVTQNSTSWSITASGQTQAITNAGNIEAYPLLEFTPTSYPAGGYGYSRKVVFYPTSTLALQIAPLKF